MLGLPAADPFNGVEAPAYDTAKISTDDVAAFRRHLKTCATLPPSVLATLGSQRTSGGYTPLSVATLTEQELAPSRFLISGQQTIVVNVVR